MPTDVVLAQSGEVDAYNRLVMSHARFAAAIALARTGRPELAEEVAQEAFLDAWRCIKSLRHPAAFSGWLRRIVIKHADRITRRKQDELFSDDVVMTDPGPSPETHVAAASDRRSMLDALSHLPAHQREVCALFYLSGQAHAEIAHLLDLSVSTVKKRLHDARKRLAPTLEVPMTWSTQLPQRVRAFVAARAGRTDVLAEVLDANPALITATATTDPESLATRYVPAGLGQTLLLEAISYGNTDAVALLLDRGASLEAETGSRRRALYQAVEQDFPDVVQLLLERGANPNAPLWHGGTALHMAARRGRTELEKLLLAHGADPNAQDRFGHVASDWRPEGAPRLAPPRAGDRSDGPRSRWAGPAAHPCANPTRRRSGPPRDGNQGDRLARTNGDPRRSPHRGGGGCRQDRAHR